MANHIRAGQRIRVLNEDRALSIAATGGNEFAGANYDYGTVYGQYSKDVYNVLMDNGEKRLFFADDFEPVTESDTIAWWIAFIGLALVGYIVLSAIGVL